MTASRLEDRSTELSAQGDRVYFGFDGWSDVAGQFNAEIGDEPQYVYALYELPSYEGYARVVFHRDGKWWLATGSHCSCYGLEDQWQPEELDAGLHIRGRAEGKTLANIHDYEGDYPEATQDAFDEWLSSRAS